MLKQGRRNQQGRNVSVIARLVIEGVTLLAIAAITIAGWVWIGELGFPNAWSNLVASRATDSNGLGDTDVVSPTPSELQPR